MRRKQRRSAMTDPASRHASQADCGDRIFGAKSLAAYMTGVLAGIGGLTLDPGLPDALRMRRFYVHPAFRRHGIGRGLAVALLQLPGTAGRGVTVNAGTAEASVF